MRERKSSAPRTLPSTYQDVIHHLSAAANPRTQSDRRLFNCESMVTDRNYNLGARWASYVYALEEIEKSLDDLPMDRPWMEKTIYEALPLKVITEKEMESVCRALVPLVRELERLYDFDACAGRWNRDLGR